jgi:hypothetical protein
MNALKVDWLRGNRAWLLTAVTFSAALGCIEGASTGLAQSRAQPPFTQAAAPQSAPAGVEGLSVEDEVLGNILRQAIGRHSVADLNLPEAFLRREADRIIRSSFEDQYRIVVRDPAARTLDAHVPAAGTTQPQTQPDTPPIQRAAAGAIDLFEPPLSQAALEYRRSLRQGRPSNRGFMVRLRDDEPAWPLDEPSESAPQAVRDAADIVARRLAFDGLLPTMAAALATLGPEPFVDLDDGNLATLREIGLPIDLLRHFALADGVTDRDIIQRIASRLHGGAALDDVQREVRSAAFRFRATCPGFIVASESGEIEPGLIRAQMTRGGYWKGEGDGGNADLLRRTIDALPEAHWVVSIEMKHAREFADSVQSWPLTSDRQFIIVPEPMAVAQWAQDNGKAGVISPSLEGEGQEVGEASVGVGVPEEDGAVETNQRATHPPAPSLPGRESARLALLVPRYASWGDDGSAFVAGENFLLIGVAAAAGAELIHSPLLFQGGNTLCVREPRRGAAERLLLIADADVYRNVSLGLTTEQTLEAFRVEFGVDRCEMLPAVSFHLDYDVSVRAMGGKDDSRLIALVNDPVAAAKSVLEIGANALQQAGLVDETAAREAIAALHNGEHRGYLERIAPIVYSMGGEGGRFPLSLAERFSTSHVDSGVGNLHRFLLALDLLVSGDLAPHEMPASRHARSYLQSLQRREADRAALHQRLRDLGMQVVATPSTSEATRSITAINGIHLRDVYLMPAYGGLYAPLDALAVASVRKALGDSVRVIPIICGESQRRCGAIHCSLSVFPRLPDDDVPSTPGP